MGFFVYKYLQFRTAFLEKQRIELAREDKKKQEEAEQKALHEKYARCKTAKPILEVTYKDNLLSVNIDCVWAGDVLKEISKKIGVKIDFNPKGLTTTDIPISFSNLSIKDGLDIIGKSEVGTGDNFISRYLIDKNIWSFDKVIIEVKDPPKDGVTHVVETKDSYDFVRADGMNKVSYKSKWSYIKKSDNNEFVGINRYHSNDNKEFIVLNNQGDVQWKFNANTDLCLDHTVSNNGKYMIADSADCEDGYQGPSFIITEKYMNAIRTASKDQNFFLTNSESSGFFDVYNNKSNEVYVKKTLEEVRELVPDFNNFNPNIKL
ncbi:hypothetical protein HY212_03495 [Candidatus Pacearchaeota archaeon]|nr:hypothetical protein [Candidatus Pacearchaeota archaeon]